MILTEQRLRDWVPYKLYEDDGQLLCKWLFVGDNLFKEPFFDDTIAHCKSLPVNCNPYHCVSDLLSLPYWSLDTQAIAPTAIIFHVSRCGSTLLSQLLGLNNKHVVLSEVPFFDEVLRTPYNKCGNNIKNVNMGDVLKAAILFYAQIRNGDEEKLFIKTDSWHLFFYNQLRALYPKIPFILLYRRPDAVLRSHQKKRGMQAVPGVIEPEVFGFTQAQATYNNLDAYTIKVIERYFEVLLDISKNDSNAILINYNEGIPSMLQKIADATGLLFSPPELAAMEVRGRYHAKFPDQVFSETIEDKNSDSQLLKAFELYAALDKERN